jgi:hypothetical protein
MIHKTISAANELRAPPLARRKRPELVNHSRLPENRAVGLDAHTGCRDKLQLAMPPKTNKRVGEPSGDNVR